MNQYLSSVSLKSLARGQLLGNYGALVGIYLIQLLCTAPISLAISLLIGTNTLLNILLYTIAQFLFGLLTGYFLAGQFYISLKVACLQPFAVSDLFYFFREDTSKVLYIQVILSGISTLCSLPSLISGHYVNLSIMELASKALSPYELPVDAPLFLFYTMLYVIGNVINIYIRYILFSQVFYLMVYFTDNSADTGKPCKIILSHCILCSFAHSQHIFLRHRAAVDTTLYADHLRQLLPRFD